MEPFKKTAPTTAAAGGKMTQIKDKRKTASAPKDKVKRPPGRPSGYSKELGERICDLIATSDKGLTHICRANPDLPDKDTIRLWTWRYPEFHAQYLRAREAQQEWMAERAMEIADDGTNDTYIDQETGQPKIDHDVIQRSRLRVETIKWQAGKLAPKRFGDKIDVNHGGQPDNPMKMLYEQITGTPMKPKEE